MNIILSLHTLLKVCALSAPFFFMFELTSATIKCVESQRRVMIAPSIKRHLNVHADWEIFSNFSVVFVFFSYEKNVRQCLMCSISIEFESECSAI